jgi:CDGSH-type Zn-finger protein/uncharacterized Fe-S cluster protein YjdI
VIVVLAQQQARLAELDRRPSAALKAPATPAATTTATAAAAPTAALAEASGPAELVETAKGQGITIEFEGRRCIHSRHCVLDAPTVFEANTPGAWIHPDAVPVETVVAVALNCPSGAIRYSRHDGGPAEAAPLVNTLRLRENGPYAIHAPLTLAGQSDGFRATLCRCGASARKPWCDGSHAAAGFTASGEPLSGNVAALAERDGLLEVTPLRNGPLQLRGNLEICAGTGRTVARVVQARLCRCGQSNNKPFCDLTHVSAGFVAAGE